MRKDKRTPTRYPKSLSHKKNLLLSEHLFLQGCSGKSKFFIKTILVAIKKEIKENKASVSLTIKLFASLKR
jgi:hypothetical protein